MSIFACSSFSICLCILQASIPAVVTAIDDFTIFTAVPTWYSELPSGVRSFYDDAAKRVENLLEQVAPSDAPISSGSAALLPSNVPANSSAIASPTGNVTTPAITPSGSTPPESTGKAGKVEVGVMGAGIVAGLAGVLMM
jgi:hypothetical protein